MPLSTNRAWPASAVELRWTAPMSGQGSSQQWTPRDVPEEACREHTLSREGLLLSMAAAAHTHPGEQASPAFQSPTVFMPFSVSLCRESVSSNSIHLSNCCSSCLFFCLNSDLSNITVCQVLRQTGFRAENAADLCPHESPNTVRVSRQDTNR